MTEPRPQIERALERVEARWDGARSERTLPGARGKLASRRRRDALLAGALVLALIGGGAAWLGGVLPGAPIASTGDAARSRALSFEDGSRALLLDDAARVVVSAVSSSTIAVSLESGRARFDVSKRPERSFRVDCGEVVVQVLGTSFELERRGARTHVQVSSGRVAVRWSNGATDLSAGSSGWFPPAPAEARAHVQEATPKVSGDAGATAAAAPSGARPRRADSWRQHAEQGDFGRAYALLEGQGARVADDVEELLLAADAARLSGHPAQAVPFLQKVEARHAGDPRAPLAAFTLGGVLMNQLGRPREAEAAYGRARALAPDSSLSQDALARQVEAAHRAGDQARARALALEYLERHPDGRRLNAVRRFGGLP